MGVEIERKFLLLDDSWKALGQGVLLRQGYLSSHPDRVVRVRIEGDAAVMTVKGRTQGTTRSEWEYPLPMADAKSFLDDLCEKPIIEKVRYRVTHDGMVWEIDEFLGENTGLVVAEIELEYEEQTFSRPQWLGAEVSSDPRYFNTNLLRHPYMKW